MTPTIFFRVPNPFGINGKSLHYGKWAVTAMGQDIKIAALVFLTLHWNIMENQTSLSVHWAIKDKCVCYCSHSVFLSVLCGPLGDVQACCRSAINPKLRLFSYIFIYRKGRLLSGWRLTMARGWIETYMTGSTKDWMDNGVWWMACPLLNHKALTPSETLQKQVWKCYKSKDLNIPWVALSLCAI